MKKYFLGIDLGGTNTKLGIGSSDGELLHTEIVETRVADGPQAWVERVVRAARSWKTDFEAVGVGSPGPLNSETGTIISTPNLKTFIGYSMRAAYSKAFDRPVYFENDANCAALGELHFGPHKGQKDIVVITLGTGVGSGVISSGKLVRGHQGFASELGHMVINASGPKCLCGRVGCFEAYVGAGNTRRRFAELMGLPDATGVSMKEIFRHALTAPNDPQNHVAVMLLNEWVDALALGLANTISIFNPGVIILSGGITESWQEIRPKLLEKLNPLVEPYVREQTKIEVSQLGQFFGVLGALANAAQLKSSLV